MGGLLMKLTCKHCNELMYEKPGGSYFHTADHNAICKDFGTLAEPVMAKPKQPQPERLGCPRCGCEDLTLAQIAFEPARFYTDGSIQCDDGISDYGATVALLCEGKNCDWMMGSLPDDLDVSNFIEVHKAAIREEMLKEMMS